MSIFELPKPCIISADSSTGSGIVYHPDSGFISRTVQKREKPDGEASRVASYRLGVLPSGEVLATYDLHLPAGIASVSVYENGGDEIAADFSIQANEWSREKILAESVFTPRMISTVVRGQTAMLGCTVENSGSEYYVELYDLNDDKSIRGIKQGLLEEAQTVIDGVRIRRNKDNLFFQMDVMGYKTGVFIPFTMPGEPYMQMHEILNQSNPLDYNPLDVPIPYLGMSVRFAPDDIYRS